MEKGKVRKTEPTGLPSNPHPKMNDFVTFSKKSQFLIHEHFKNKIKLKKINKERKLSAKELMLLNCGFGEDS